jgi:hypothetical protein
MQAQQVTQQQQQQMQSQEIQKNQFELQDREAGMKAMQQWSGKDWNELPDLIQKNGGSLQAVMGARTGIVKQQTDVAAMNKAQLDVQKTKADYLLGKLQSATDTSVPDEQLVSSVTKAAQESVQDGYLDPQHAQALQQIVQQYANDPAGLRSHMGLFEKSYQAQSEQFSQAQKAKEVAATELSAQARASAAKTGAERLAAEMPGGKLEAPEKAEMQDYLNKNPGKGPADYAKWKASLAPQAGIAAQGTPDPGLAAAVANGQMRIQDVITPRMPLPLRQQFLKQILAINPQFNAAQFDIEKGVQKAFTSGPEAKNLTAFNTAIEHANQLSKATDALDNGDLPTLNKIGNAVGYQFGSDKMTNFNVIKNALSGEISKVFKGGQATDAEIKEVQGPFSAANSPKQLKGAIDNAIKLMNSKRDALKQQYEKGIQGKPNFGGVTVTAPDGSVHQFDTQEQADGFKKLAGIK